jgi:hypothetical protein
MITHSYLLILELLVKLIKEVLIIKIDMQSPEPYLIVSEVFEPIENLPNMPFDMLKL